MKVVINKCFDGFGVSEAGMLRYAEIKGITLYPEMDGMFSRLTGPTFYTVPKDKRTTLLEGEAWANATLEERRASNAAYSAERLYDGDFDRADPVLVQVVEELGEKANSRFSQLAVVEIPDGIEYEIDEYDGLEHIAEKHRTWS